MHISPQMHTPTVITPSSPAYPPTNSESAHLVSLVPLHCAATAPTSVPEILAAVFHLPRQRWVADFLFSPDMNPLSALTAPVNLHHAISCTVTMTSIERPVGLPRCDDAPPNPFDIHMHGDYVFIPAFSVGSISVGFGIQNCAVKCHADWALHREQKRTCSLNHFRYVRDDARGILLNVREDRASEFLKLDYMAHESTTKRRRSFLTVERAAIETALKEDTAGLDPEKLITAVTMIQTALEYRDCPYCGVAKGNLCSCKLQIQTPKHPLDFGNMVANMGSHLGSFEGVAMARFCTAGMELMSAKLGSRISIDCTLDNELMEKMSKWAISDQLKNVKEDPVRCIMPSPDEEMTDAGFQGVVGSGFASGEATEVDIGGEVGDREMDTVQRMDALIDEMTRPMKNVDFGDVTAAGFDNMLGLNKHGLDTTTTEQLFEQVSPATTEGDDEIELANEIAREAQLAYQVENGLVDQSVPSGTSATALQTLNGYELSGDLIESAKLRQQEEKERKAELRRQRNREAAQRSNAKRKEKNDTLKAELRESHSKATELRAKELALREENIRLRKMLS